MLNETETFYPENQKAWRNWLKENHAGKSSVGVIFYKKQSGTPTISWSEAVDEALCFGWIDSTRRTIDENRFVQTFTKRKAKSTWSKINKDKIERLIAKKKMAKAGLKSIEIAKENGSWTILDSVEELVIPKDLEDEFKKHAGTKKMFMALSKSVKKQWLHRLLFAKTTATKEKRIKELLALLKKI